MKVTKKNVGPWTARRDASTVENYGTCRFRQELSEEYLIAVTGVDAAENELRRIPPPPLRTDRSKLEIEKRWST